LVDTLENILRGRRELFKGLWIDGSDYDWTPNPVIRLSLNGIDDRNVDRVESGLILLLKSIAKEEGLSLAGDNPSEAFKSLFDELFDKYGRKVVVLIDEYDAPIVAHLDKPELADDIRSTLRSFYNVLKANDTKRGFTFLTGVTKVAQASIFSALNNLSDLTFKEKYAAICGFTLNEFDSLFTDHMKNFLIIMKSNGTMPPESTISDLRQIMLDWYDGYSWDGKTRVLNPWSILNTFDNNAINNYWARSVGRPSYLVNIAKAGITDFTSFKPEEPINDDIDVIELGEKLEPLPVLFQSGYLTVDRVDNSALSKRYYLKIPNLEVAADIIPVLLSLKSIPQPSDARKYAESMLRALTNLDTEGFQDSFSKYLQCFAFYDHVNYEAHYRALFKTAMYLAGHEIQSEVAVGDGRYDASFQTPNGTLFIFEIKHIPLKKPKGRKAPYTDSNEREMADKAIKQIEDKGYTKRYMIPGRDIYKVALVVVGRTDVFARFKKEEETA
jgi:hypothetical protein